MKNILTKIAVEYKTHLAIGLVVVAAAAAATGFWIGRNPPPPKCGKTDVDLAACTAKVLHKLGAPEAALIQCLAIDTPGEYRCVVTPAGTDDNACYSLIVKRGARGFPIPVKLEANGVC